MNLELVKNDIKQYIHDITKLAQQNDNAIKLYALIDVSRNPEILTVVEGLGDKAQCLYIGKARDEFSGDAPWLVQVDEHKELMEYLVDHYLGQRWGVFILSHQNFDKIFQHLRKFIKIKDVDRDEFVFFRFYDPEVLEETLWYLTLEQRAYFFEPIHELLIESSAKNRVALNQMSLQEGNCIENNVQLFEFEEVYTKKDILFTFGDPVKELSKFTQFNVKGAGIQPLALTSDQIEAPILYNRSKLIESVMEYLKEDFADVINHVPYQVLKMNINHGINLALSYNLFDVGYVQLFVDFMMRFAPGWHKQPSLNYILKDHSITSEEKFNSMVEPQYDDAWQEALTFNGVDEWIDNNAWEALKTIGAGEKNNG